MTTRRKHCLRTRRALKRKSLSMLTLLSLSHMARIQNALSFRLKTKEERHSKLSIVRLVIHSWKSSTVQTLPSAWNLPSLLRNHSIIRVGIRQHNVWHVRWWWYVRQVFLTVTNMQWHCLALCQRWVMPLDRHVVQEPYHQVLTSLSVLLMMIILVRHVTTIGCLWTIVWLHLL